MRTTKTIHVISAHAEGEVGDVIVGGVAPPPGETLWVQSRFIAADETLRNFVLNEPRGGVFRHVNLLVPPKDPRADAAFIIMEPEDTPPMSGSNSICVATVLLDAGILPMTEPVTTLTLEAPGGLVRVRAECEGGKARRIFVENLPSFAAELAVPLDVPGLGALTVDTAYGGDDQDTCKRARGLNRFQQHFMHQPPGQQGKEPGDNQRQKVRHLHCLFMPGEVAGTDCMDGNTK